MELLFIYLLLGVVAGLLAGLLGVGGGLVIVPVLLVVFREYNLMTDYEMHVAIASSLATIVITSISSIYTHHKKAAVRWDLFRLLLPGLVLGGMVGVWMVTRMSSEGLATIFAIFEIMVAIRMLRSNKVRPVSHQGKDSVLVFSGMIVGGCSSFLGIGGGTLTVPLLNWRGISMHQAIATSAACGLPIALVGILGFMVFPVLNQSGPVEGYIYWPAVLSITASSFLFASIGAHWAHNIPAQLLQRVFAGLLLLLGLFILF